VQTGPLTKILETGRAPIILLRGVHRRVIEECPHACRNPLFNSVNAETALFRPISVRMYAHSYVYSFSPPGVRLELRH
jgi:hypothetical protein